MEGETGLLMALETGQSVPFRHKTPPSVESGHTVHLQRSCGQNLAGHTAEGLALGGFVSDSPAGCEAPQVHVASSLR